MKFLHNNKILKDRRRELRRHETKAEEILWSHLRNKQLDGLKFYRQYSVGSYIVDFYCPKTKLAIELDGPSHATEDAKIYDDERSLYLAGLDIKVVRFKNEEVIGAINKVLNAIKTPA